MRDVWVLNRQVKDDDDLLDPHYIKDVAVETNATIYLQGSVANELILFR